MPVTSELGIAAGAGYEYTYDVPYTARGDHRAAQAKAQRDGVGLWDIC